MPRCNGYVLRVCVEGVGFRVQVSGDRFVGVPRSSESPLPHIGSP